MSKRLSKDGNTGNQADGAVKADVDAKDIEALAYLHWQQRGAPVGSPEIDWLRAEAELRNRSDSSQRAA